MNTCTAEFARLATGLGGLRCDANPILTLTNPFSLQSWTMPVIELLLVTSAVASLVHALRWRRATGDTSNLVLWISSIVSLLLIEPFAYFPQWWGLEKWLGLTFVHNQFSVQFLYDRLPLYIVAMYPAYSYLAWILVQRTGILRHFNPLVSAACVAFIFQCFYEVVDTVAVQFKWWRWNDQLEMAHPTLGAVPYVNVQAFGIGLPFGLALTVLLTSKLKKTRWSVLRDVGIVSVAVWPLQWVSFAPARILNVFTSTDAARVIATWFLIAATGIVTAWAFSAAYRARSGDPDFVPVQVRGDFFALVSAAVYLASCVMFWGAALPDYLAAVNGVTQHGAPTGSLTYGVVTFVLSIALTVGAYSKTWGRPPAITGRGVDPRQQVLA